MTEALLILLSAALGSALFCFYGQTASNRLTAFVFVVATLGGWLLSPAFARLADIDEPEIFAFLTAFVIFPLSKKFLHWVKDFTVEKIFQRFFGGNKK